MEAYTISGLSFTYPERQKQAIDNITMKIYQGELVTICGKSGSGKSTLLRHLKTVLTPHGNRRGSVLFEGIPLEQLDQRQQTSDIGFVMQNPDNQIVMDKVWHELAFGMESLGYDTKTIRLRVGEMANFFGIEDWFYKAVEQLSGGQKQLLNLAAVMVMQPKVLLLDEPTCQLDPIAAGNFLTTVHRINRELGITVILTEHRLEEILPISDRMIVMEQGRVIADDTPRQAGLQLKELNNDMFFAMPTPMQIYCGVENQMECPLTVREGRQWLDRMVSGREVAKEQVAPQNDPQRPQPQIPVVKLKNIWFHYEKTEPAVLKDLSLTVNQGTFYAITGGNGAGKTTAISVMMGLRKPYRGSVWTDGRRMGVLPQNPQMLFVRNTVELDLMEILAGSDLTEGEKREKVRAIAEQTEITQLLSFHPYDLSGGEQQRAALAKVLLTGVEILLLDEPTKGMDYHFKMSFSKILKSYLVQGGTIIMVSHDIEFIAQYADVCGLFFDGSILAEGTPHSFFSGNGFYTTAANRMSRHLFPDAITAEEVIKACNQ